VVKKKPASPPAFEESLEQLEAIVGKLEGGQLPLGDSLEQYELGIRNLRLCYKMLSHVEKKVELLSGLDVQGKPLTEPFGDLEEEPENDSDNLLTRKKGASLAKKGASRSRRRSSPAGKKPPTNLSPTDTGSPSSIDASTNIDEGGTLF
jgi:exodeoxyribonuclease VII small subunit